MVNNGMPTKLPQRRVRPLPAPKYRLIVVFPAELGDKIRALAEQERRPISSQVRVLVERGLDYEPAAVA